MSFQGKLAPAVFAGASFLCAAVTLCVLGFMVVLSLPVLKSGMSWQILTGAWSPDHGTFGILSMVAGTFFPTDRA